LKPRNKSKVRQMMYNFNEEIEARTGGEWIANNLLPSDNVIVPTYTIDPFWLMLVDKGPHFVELDF
jgi:Rps23 Pro-64 3,4-dihydroxylase Tpa1-like proline 4-hydroxylase